MPHKHLYVNASFLLFSVTLTSLLCDILEIVLCRNVDRPELCQISLYDFQKFLQMDQKVLNPPPVSTNTQLFSENCSVLTTVSGPAQESWASDLNRVREFLLGYMRGGAQPEPMLQLDEVKHKTLE